MWVGGLSLAVLAVVAPAHDAVSSALWLPSRAVLVCVLVGALAIHIAESCVAARRARAGGLSPAQARAWSRQALAWGFPVLLALSRRLRTAQRDQ